MKRMLDVRLPAALADAPGESRSGEQAAFDAAADDAQGYLDTIFDLASLR